MTAAIGQSEWKSEVASPSPQQELGARDLMLLRVAAGGATRADLQRDVAPLLAPRVSGSEFRRSAELAISTLVGNLLVNEAKGRLTLTAKGQQVVAALLPATRGAAAAVPATWA